MSKLLLNYTTTIPVSKTLGEIQKLLAEAGADHFSVRYGKGAVPVGVVFAMQTAQGALDYRLPVDAEKVLAMLECASNEWVRVKKKYSYGSERRRRVPQSHVTPEHAAQVGWRVIKDWLEAQVALIQIGLVSLDEVMLPYQLTADGMTIYELAREKGLVK